MNQAPAHLSPEASAWYLSVVKEWDLEAHHIRLLTLCGEAWDRAEQARRRIKRDGIIFTTRFGEPRAHPAVKIEQDAKTLFYRLLDKLGLDPDESRPPGRPVGRGS